MHDGCFNTVPNATLATQAKDCTKEQELVDFHQAECLCLRLEGHLDMTVSGTPLTPKLMHIHVQIRTEHSHASHRC